MNRKSFLMFAFFVIVTMNLLDAFTTQLVIVDQGTSAEYNLLARSVFEAGGIKLILYEFFKFVAWPFTLALAISGAMKYEKKNPITLKTKVVVEFTTIVVILAAVQMSLVVINNVFVAHSLGLIG